MAFPYPAFIKALLKTAVPIAVKRHLHELSSANSVEISLSRLKDLGFTPAWVVDIGAYVGNWTRMARRIFPQARFIMIEALEERRRGLEAVASEFPNSISVEMCLLGAERDRQVPFFAMETGSSMYEELTSSPRQRRIMTMRILDDVLARYEIPEGAMLLKLDVQGAELDVLRGGPLSLDRAPVVVLEVPVTGYNKGAPSLEDVLSFMGQRGYRLFDIAALIRPDGIRLMQMDAVFVRDGFSI